MSGFNNHPEFQELLAAFLLKEHRAMSNYYEKISISHFDDPVTGWVVNSAIQFFEKHRQLPNYQIVLELIYKGYPDNNDPKQVQERSTCEDKAAKLFEIEIRGEEMLYEEISNFISHQAFMDELTDCIDNIQQGVNPDIETMDKFRKALLLGDLDTEQGTMAIKSMEQVVANETDPEWNPPIPTGIHHLDVELSGGLRPGELGIFLGPPKGFKSGTLLNICVGALQRGVGVNVLYLTLELSEHLQELRFVLRTSGMTKDQMHEDPKKFLKKAKAKAANCYAEGVDMTIKFFPPGICTANKIRNYIDQVQEDTGVKFGLIAIDYLDLLGSDTKKEKDYLEKNQIATDLRQLAIDYHVPVWTAARSNAEGAKQSAGSGFLQMFHMSGSFERVAIADVILGLRRNADDIAEGVLKMSFVATRNEGGSGVVNCRCQPEKMRITSISLESPEDSEPDPPEHDNYKDGPAKKSKKNDDKARADKALERIKSAVP